MEGEIKTIEDSAAPIQRTMASKEDLHELANKEDLIRIEGRSTILTRGWEE